MGCLDMSSYIRNYKGGERIMIMFFIRALLIKILIMDLQAMVATIIWMFEKESDNDIVYDYDSSYRCSKRGIY